MNGTKKDVRAGGTISKLTAKMVYILRLGLSDDAVRS